MYWFHLVFNYRLTTFKCDPVLRFTESQVNILSVLTLFSSYLEMLEVIFPYTSDSVKEYKRNTLPISILV